MSDNASCANESSNRRISEAVCIDTSRVYDSCADKDCLADLRVYFTDSAQTVIDAACAIRCKCCEVIDVSASVDKVPFNSGYYSVDITFFFRVSLDAIINPSSTPETVHGLCMFTKKCILYGSEGSVKVFSSEFSNDSSAPSPLVSTNPRAKIQVAQPLCLDAKLCRPCDCCNNITDTESCIPLYIRRCFNGNFGPPSNTKAVRVTIGLFSIIQLERDVQMLIPAYDFCMPAKECSCNTEDPCDSFRKIRFPVSEFFPPNNSDNCDNADISFNPSCCCGE